MGWPFLLLFYHQKKILSIKSINKLNIKNTQIIYSVMEKRIKSKVNKYINDFKKAIKDKVEEFNFADKDNLMQYISNFPELEINKEDLMKRKRVKNIIPTYERCCAKRANGEQCTRKKRKGESLCGTHIKGTPHGTVDVKENEPKIEKIEVWSEDIKGIIYYVDKNNNVYDNQDIFEMKTNPKKIAKWSLDEDNNIFIPEFQ